jgi:hypothetical protein
MIILLSLASAQARNLSSSGSSQIFSGRGKPLARLQGMIRHHPQKPVQDEIRAVLAGVDEIQHSLEDTFL